MAAWSFGSERRLHKPADYDAVFKGATGRVSRPELLILAAPNQLPSSRLGTVVSKKTAGNAVERNRIRRLIKESFRLRSLVPGFDVVVVARRPIRDVENRALLKIIGQGIDDLSNRIGTATQ